MQTESAPCVCLPFWLLHAGDDSCNHCIDSFSPTEKRLLCFFLYPCVFEPDMIHSVGITLHEHCIKPYMANMVTTGRDKFVMVLPVQPEQLSADAELAATISTTCKQEHVFDEPKLRCNKCNVCKQKHTKFYKCAQCKAVSYCGSTCQREDWNKHKQDCKHEKQM